MAPNNDRKRCSDIKNLLTEQVFLTQVKRFLVYQVVGWILLSKEFYTGQF